MTHGDAESRLRARRRNRTALLGLFALFGAPILLAYALNVWWPSWSPFGRINHGEIIEATWTLELATVGQDVANRAAGRWILLHPAGSRCTQDCEAVLELTRRVHISLGKDYDRVVRMFVHRADLAVDRDRPTDAELIVVPAPSAWFDRFAGDEPALLLVDPQSQAVLRYGGDLQGNGLAGDLARVLKISKIG